MGFRVKFFTLFSKIKVRLLGLRSNKRSKQEKELWNNIKTVVLYKFIL